MMQSMNLGNRRHSLPLTKIEKETVPYVPPEKFHYSISEYNLTLPWNATPSGNEGSKFDKLLLRRWNEAKRSGALQYDLNLLYKTLPGRYGLTAQLNMERATHRRKPQSFRSMDEPFDSRRFNFGKIRPEEVLFELFNESNRNNEHEEIKCSASSTASSDCSLPGERHLIIVNNSPIEKGHSLLVPWVDKCLPQKVTLDGIKLAVECMLLSSCRLFFIIYNSLLAHASVNHLHFHLYYWPYATRIITWPVTRISGHLYSLNSWLIPTFVLQLQNNDLDDFATKITTITEYFHEKSVPHNIFMARAPSLSILENQARARNVDNNFNSNDPPATNSEVDTEDEALRTSPLYVTVYIFPRKAAFGAKPVMNFAPAACECGGHLLVYTSSFFQAVHEARIMHIFEEETYLENGLFYQLSDELKKHPVFCD